jgi:hypothetical protein
MRQLDLRRLGQLILLSVLALASSPSKDRPLQITTVPPASPGGPDKMDRIAGVVNTDCENCAVVLFALGDVWYVQPGTASPYTTFDANGKWSTDTHLGTEYAALLVRRSYKPPARTITLPTVQGDVLALVRVRGRQPSAPRQAATVPQESKVLRFSGRDWVVKTSHQPVGPGPNVFSSRNAWVDSKGKLHLKISNEGGQWTCAEVVCRRKGLGYGLYRFKVGDTSAFPPDVVLGLFTWDSEASEQHNREIDIELSRWNDPDNANGQFVVQPYTKSENIDRFAIPRGATEHQFLWAPGVLSFQSMQITGASARKIHEHTFRSGVPVPGNEQIRLNLWLADGQPPQSRADVEVTIDTFEFQPRTASK